MNRYSLIIREAHLDTFGHVNNATYLQLYEEARWDIITRGGYGLKDIQEKRQGPVILEVNVKFLRELTLREEITITTVVQSYDRKIGRMLQQILKADGSVASEAVFTFGLFDLSTRRLIAPTEEWKQAISWAG